MEDDGQFSDLSWSRGASTPLLGGLGLGLGRGSGGLEEHACS